MFGPDSNRKLGLHYLNPERLTHVSHGVRSIGVYPVGVDLRYAFQGVDFLGVHLMAGISWAGISGGHLTAPTLGDIRGVHLMGAVLGPELLPGRNCRRNCSPDTSPVWFP
jgi:hypothetical protein